MKKLKLTAFSDAGHGWVAVKRSMLKELGLENTISSCSFQRGNTVYLECDGDLTAFAEAMEKKHGKPFKELVEQKTSYSERSAIRGYARYNPNTVEKIEVGMEVMLYGKRYKIAGTNHKGNFIISGEAGTYRLSKTQESELIEVKE